MCVTCRHPSSVRLRGTSWLDSLTAGVQITQPSHPPHGQHEGDDAGGTLELRKIYGSRVTCPLAELSIVTFKCLCINVPLISHLHGAPCLFPLQGFQFRVLNMWLIQLPLPSPAWLHSCVICLPARSDPVHTTGRQSNSYFQGHSCLRRVLLEGMFPGNTCVGCHPSGCVCN